MMMWNCLAPIIPVRSLSTANLPVTSHNTEFWIRWKGGAGFSGPSDKTGMHRGNRPRRLAVTPWALGFGLLFLFTTAHAQTLESLAHEYRDHPTAQTRAALQHYATVHAKDRDGALAQLVLGNEELDAKQYPAAIEHLQAAEKRLPELADYVGFLKASAQFEQHNLVAADSAIAPALAHSPVSPLLAKAVLLAANTAIQQNDPKKALALLEQNKSALAAEKLELLLAKAYEAAGDGTSAAEHFSRIYTEYPQTPEADEAGAALAHYPPLTPKGRLVRCSKLLDVHEYTKAKSELETLIPQLNGEDLDVGRVRLGAAMFYLKDAAAALHYLRPLEVQAPEADAERLFYLTQAARRLDAQDDLKRSLDDLASKHADSPWRLRAIIGAGYYYRVKNQPADSEAAYRACYESFPNDPQAASCQWNVTWSQYLKDRQGARDLLAAHVKNYPGSENASASLYFLGRIAESANDPGSARVYYEKITAQFPNEYYALLARARMNDAAIGKATPSDAAGQFLAAITFPQRVPTIITEANDANKVRIERARLLASAGLADLAEGELRFGAQHDGQSQLMAIELAQLAVRQNAPDRGIRLIKHYAPGYMNLPFDTSTQKLWRLAFPLPFWKSLEGYSQERGLDPFMVAGLIRQESEFNPKVISPANAYGLTQVLPSTGRELSRRLNIRPFRANMLFSPDVNLEIGTYYLKIMLDSLNGDWEQALASYNAGKSRVLNWRNWSTFQEPAEFVESIPFTETRNYVQNVLRNADVYRRLYAGVDPVALASTDNGNSSDKDPGSTGSTRKSQRTVPQRTNSKLHRVRNS